MAINTRPSVRPTAISSRRKPDVYSKDWTFRQLFPDLSGLDKNDRHLAQMGIFCMLWVAFAWLTPQAVGGFFLTPFPPLGIAIVFNITASIRRKNAMPLAFVFAMIMIMQIWSFIANMHSEMMIGRPLVLNRSAIFWTYDLMYLLLAWHLVNIVPAARQFISRVILGAFGLSSFFAWLQFARVPFAVKLSQIWTYKPIDNWDGHPGIRAVGLCYQPNVMMYEAIVGLLFVIAPVIHRRLTALEIAAAVFFSGAAVFSQARAGFPTLAIIWLILVVFAMRHDKRQARVILSVMGLALIGLAAIAAKRFDYLAMTTSGKDYSTSARADMAWAQLDPIYPRFAWTGIGPSDGLLLGGGPEDKYVPIGKPMESGYRVILAMNGIPGVSLFILTLVGCFVSAGFALRNPENEQHRLILVIAIVLTFHVALNAYAFNTVDGYVFIPCSMLVAGMAMRTRPVKRRAPLGMNHFPAITPSSS